LTFDETSNVLTSHVEAGFSFNNGKPGGGTDLFGVLTIDASGIPPGLGIEFFGPVSGVLRGAGPFDGTVLFGSGGHKWFVITHDWDFLTDMSFLDLPPPFVNGHAIPISGQMTAQFVVPEPSTFLLLGIGLIGLLGYGWRRRKQRT
jgi:hypothetical protein